MREQLGFPPGTRVVGYISSIVEYEGIDTLLRAMSDVEVALESLRIPASDVAGEPAVGETLAQRLRRNHPALDDESLDLYADELPSPRGDGGRSRAAARRR